MSTSASFNANDHVTASDRSRPTIEPDARGMDQASQNWGWLVAAGVCTSIAGVLAIGAPMASSLAVETIIAIACSTGGAAWIIGAFKTHSWRGFAIRVAIGFVQLSVGLIMFFNPIVGLVSLTMLIVVFFFTDGFLRIVAAVQNRQAVRGWGWVVASGVITVVFAGVMAAQLPSAALVLIGILAGANLIMSGAIQIAYGFAARRLSSVH